MAKLTYADIIANDSRFTAIADRANQLDRIDYAALMTRLVDLVEPEHLILLADALHVMGDEGWDYADTDEQKRNLIKMAIPLHRRKGTPWAVKQLLANYGLLDKINMVEWWQPHPLPRPQPPKTVDLITDAATAPDLVRVLPSLEQTKPAGTVLRPVTLQLAEVDNHPTWLILAQARQRIEAKVPTQVGLALSHAIGVMTKVRISDPYQILTFLHTSTAAVLTSNYSHKTSSPPLFRILTQEIQQ